MGIAYSDTALAMEPYGSTRVSVEFDVFGVAKPAGSKRAFMRPGMAHPSVVDANPLSREWKNLVADKAALEMGEDPPLDGPLKLGITFYMPRPKSHYGSGRNVNIVKLSAPPFPTSMPDLTKLTRAVEDAMTGIVYRDDAQIVVQMILKRYAERPHAHILVGTLL